MRTKLAADFRLWTTTIERHHQAADGTEKLLLRLEDGHTIECVLLRDGGRRTICISSQVGCAMGCVFCASGLDGVIRNLTAGEIVEQMLRLARLLPAEERLSHIVVMGMGEPLANLDRLLPALAEATSRPVWASAIAASRFPPSGCRRRLIGWRSSTARFQLAVSLHAPDDALRNQLVPVNKNIGLEAIVDRGRSVFRNLGPPADVRIRAARRLERRAGSTPKNWRRCSAAGWRSVNLIPYNPVSGLPYQTPTQKTRCSRFVQILEEAGLNVQIRERKGDEINAACGQLRRTDQPGVRDQDSGFRH